jgi:hypothetical protein
MITMDASTGTTAEVAVARIRAIREYATQAERVLTELSPSTPIFLQNISEV